jgi:hypothetical protein
MIGYILDVSEMGELVTMDNGRCYAVAPDDLPTSALWYGSQEAKVIPSRSKHFSVRIQNISTSQVVKACPAS